MENRTKRTGGFTKSITFKGFIIGILTLLLLIPQVMIQGLILERKYRSEETIRKINSKWSDSQRICGPVLSIPYVSYKVINEKIELINNTLNITPELLDVNAELFPEERHYGIYKAILYKSVIDINGKFPELDFSNIDYDSILWNKAYITIGLTDLRGVTEDIRFAINGNEYATEAEGGADYIYGKKMIINLNKDDLLGSNNKIEFSTKLHLNGSSSINFIPVGRTSHVKVSGEWTTPGFIGSFSPEYIIDDKGFEAEWNVLHFNRNIPETWLNNSVESFSDTSFGVDLVETIDHYQQNMRSAKYAILFIALTFVVFFFVEILTKKRIHPVQYLLVGIALILFYSLLLSISEQLNFAIAYLIASFATISLISIYVYSIFKSKTQTLILALLLAILYVLLYVILQLEDIALLIGSIGLFVILAIIMYFSRKINWYKQDETDELSI